MNINYAEASSELQRIIDLAPRDGDWHDIHGYSVCVTDDGAAIYEPGSPTTGECDHYIQF